MFIASSLSLIPRDPFAQETRWAEDQDEDQDDKSDRILQLGWRGDTQSGQEQIRPHRLKQTQNDGSQESSGDVSNASEDRRGEGFDPGNESHVKVDHRE